MAWDEDRDRSDRRRFAGRFRRIEIDPVIALETNKYLVAADCEPLGIKHPLGFGDVSVTTEHRLNREIADALGMALRIALDAPSEPETGIHDPEKARAVGTHRDG